MSSEFILVLWEGFISTCLEAGHDEKMEALVSQWTWELISTPTYVIGCRWVYILKFRPNGSVDRYKARHVAKYYTQTYGIDYFETFSPVVWMNSIMILFSVVINLSWSLFQLDVKNAFLYGDFQLEVWMEQPPGYVAQGRKSLLSQKGYLWPQAESANVVWEVHHYHL